VSANLQRSFRTRKTLPAPNARRIKTEGYTMTPFSDLARRAALPLLVLLAALPHATLAQTAVADDDAAIRAAARSFESGWNAHDMNAMFQSFAPDIEFVNIVGMHWRGLPDVKRAHQMMHDTYFKTVPNHIEDVQVHQFSADAALAVVRWKKGAFMPPDGIARPESRDIMSMFMVKRDGRWLVSAVHNTPIDEIAARFNPVAK
jgi:uncharacterized protein (TIGR02246 family)